MLGCLETLITGAELVVRGLVILFIPMFICGIFLAFTGGTIADPLTDTRTYTEVSVTEYWCCIGTFITFFSVLLIVAIRKVF